MIYAQRLLESVKKMAYLTKLNLSYCNLVRSHTYNIVIVDHQTQHLLLGLLAGDALPAIRDLNIAYNVCGDVSVRALFAQSLRNFLSLRLEAMVDVRGMKVELVLLEGWKQRVQI